MYQLAGSWTSSLSCRQQIKGRNPRSASPSKRMRRPWARKSSSGPSKTLPLEVKYPTLGWGTLPWPGPEYRDVVIALVLVDLVEDGLPVRMPSRLLGLLVRPWTLPRFFFPCTSTFV